MVRRVFVDTNALFPISLCDLLLRLAEISLHEVLWTEALLAELAEKLEEKGIRSRVPRQGSRARGLTVKRPDAYLSEMLSASPSEVMAVVREMAADKVNPPMTTIEVLDALRRAGAGDFSRAVRKLLADGR